MDGKQTHNYNCNTVVYTRDTLASDMDYLSQVRCSGGSESVTSHSVKTVVLASGLAWPLVMRSAFSVLQTNMFLTQRGIPQNLFPIDKRS